MDNLRVAPPPLVWAIPDCFHAQCKFLYCDRPVFLMAGTVPSVSLPGQGWECTDGQTEETPACSRPRRGEATAKAIKASFSSAVWPVLFARVFLLFSPMDDRPAVWTERGHQIRGCRRSGHNFPTLEDRKEEEGWRRLEGMGHLGIFFFFLSVTWKAICAGGHAALWGLAVFSVYLQGMYEYLINESQARGKCNKRCSGSTKRSPSCAAASVLAQLPGVSLTLRIPENLIGSRANPPPHKDGVYECHSSVPQVDEWKGSVRGGRAHKDSEEAQ